VAEYRWHYLLNVKPDSHTSLDKQFAGSKQTGQVKELHGKVPKGKVTRWNLGY
jgi:hypothetical protein